MNNENADVFRNLTHRMFAGCAIPELDDEGLSNFKEVMTASLIKNLGDVIQLLGNANILVRSIIRNAEGVGVSFQQLLDWGTALKHQRNIKNSSSQHEHESSPNELKTKFMD